MTARARGALLLVVVLVSGASALFRPDRALRVAAGMTAHNLCSARFIAGLDAEATFQELVRPMASVAAPFLRYQVDPGGKAVLASVAGLFPARAVYTEGYGCRVILDPQLHSPRPAAPRPPSPPDDFAPATVVTPKDPALAAAIGRVFAESPSGPRKRVKAVVVVKDGRVVAEKYAEGFGVDTPLLSYSVAKSVTGALLGALVRQGRLKLDQPVGAPEWSMPGDPRAKVTLEDLLRMQSGLDAEETGSGFDPASQMLYVEDDMAGYAARHPLEKPPRTAWEYTSANTLLLARVLGQAVGGGPPEMRAFADRELFGPAHMDGVTMEFDGAGTFVGSAYVYAPARAFARFGVLFLADGVTVDGRQVLPEGWAELSHRSTLGSQYGAGFWTNDGPSPEAALRVERGFPGDGYYASGNRGQRIYLVPSARLVVARFGYSEGPTFGFADDLQLIATAIRVLGPR